MFAFYLHGKLKMPNISPVFFLDTVTEMCQRLWREKKPEIENWNGLHSIHIK